jgi:hypothetical protein
VRARAAQDGTRLYTVQAVEIGASGIVEEPPLSGRFQYGAEPAPISTVDSSPSRRPTARFVELMAIVKASLVGPRRSDVDDDAAQ